MKARKIVISWQPNRESKTPITSQIVSFFKLKIYKGDFLFGDIIPSQRSLAEAFKVNRSTIVEAFNQLSALGIIETHMGKGTVIANNSWSLLLGATPDWQNYIKKSLHKSNLPTIQAINNYEFQSDIVRLSTGEISDRHMPHHAISQVLSKLSELKVSYSYLEALGLLELRQELCHYLKKYKLDIKPSEILIVSGSLQGLQLISMSLLGGNSTVLVEENSYVKSLQVFDLQGIHMKAVTSDQAGMIPWLIDDQSLNDNTFIYTIPTFHNPTGITMSQSRREALLDLSKKNHLPIIEDDAYRELYFDEEPPFPIKSMDTSGNVLYLGSVSKSLAPGLRLGWIVGPEAIIERLGDIKMQSDYGASSISQWMLTYLLRDGHYDQHLVKLRQTLKDHSDHLLSLLDLYFSDIATWNKPSGGFYIWLQIKKPINMDHLFELALKEKLLINPGYVYGFKKNNAIRLSYCYSTKDQMTAGIQTLSKLIKSMS